MSKKQKKNKSVFKNGYTFVKKYKTLQEFKLQNGLTVLYMRIPGTEVVTTNITYTVGSRDEEKGQTGIAHMLEHMLFKPTLNDLKNKVDSGAMQFERETGCILNANTWKDRTTYFFSYPKEHFSRALKIEADRMHNVVLTDREFLPERNNVLSEFDMNFGDPYFALSVEIVCSAFYSHPYGHETIGFREDIEGYTIDDLQRFYKKYYDPAYATLMVIGDIDEKIALTEIVKEFGNQSTEGNKLIVKKIIEPKQNGLRRVSVERQSSTNIVGFSIKHAGFPQKNWYVTSLLASILANESDSILYTKLVDTGLASKVSMSLEPTSEENIAILYVTLTPKATFEQIEDIVLTTVWELTQKDISLNYKKILQKTLTSEIINRESSLNIAMELTEYVSASAWEAYFDTEKILREITPKEIIDLAKTMFTLKTMTIGRFVGKK